MKETGVIATLILGSLLVAPLFASSAAPAEPRVSMECKGLTATELSSLASQSSGRPLVYIPRDPTALLNLDLKSLSPTDMQGVLGRLGTMVVASEEINTDGSMADTRITLRADSVKVGSVAEALRRISEDRFFFIPHDPRQEVSLDCKSVTFSQLTEILASFGDVRLLPGRD